MPTFLTENFLLQNHISEKLYHDYAEKMPIIDYHCHLPPDEIGNDKRFSNPTEIWLKGDHYKWRAMRGLGVDENYITGNASDWEKFKAWAACVPKTIGNPLYHWTHLEMKKPFGIDSYVLNEQTAERAWKEISNKLAMDSFSARGIITSMDVRIICTTDDPVDSLEHHKAIQSAADTPFIVYPTFRPDKALAIDKPELFNQYVQALGEAAAIEISSYRDLLEALEIRHDYFHENGCRLSDYSLSIPEFEEYTEKEVEDIFLTARTGEPLTGKQTAQYKTAVIQFLGRQHAKKGWTMQLHISAMRNNSSRMFQKLGGDSGFDSISDGAIAFPLSRLLDSLDKTNDLPKTILYNLNPADNDTIAALAGNFQDGSIAGKIQFGSGWWFNDQKTGMEKQMTTLANLGILSAFVGMVTDSRSFLSYTRHEYFRRILCNIFGCWAANGEVPEDYDLLGSIIQDISYHNALKYFNFPQSRAVTQL